MCVVDGIASREDCDHLSLEGGHPLEFEEEPGIPVGAGLALRVAGLERRRSNNVVIACLEGGLLEGVDWDRVEPRLVADVFGDAGCSSRHRGEDEAYLRVNGCQERREEQPLQHGAHPNGFGSSVQSGSWCES